jgi:hypothetical protein
MIKEEDYRDLFERVWHLKVQELMHEPYDDDMIHDDFFSNENQTNYL